MKHLVFYKTNDVFLSEEMLRDNGIEVDIVPTPVQDKAYCGVCIKIEDETLKHAAMVLSSLEYKTID